MSYEKQTWNKYDELKTEEENIENGAVVTDNRMNHMETGIGDNDANLASHLADKNNPHKVTAAQVGLDEVDNVKQASKVEFDSHTSDISNPHAVTASQVGAYSKSETDTKFATNQSLTDLSTKVIANKGNLASGTDLDNVIDIGTYRIGGLTGGTDIINVPSERSGTTIYAYLTVSGTTTSVVQELIVYDSKTVSQIYSRSRSGSTPTFSPWSKTVMADDSGKVKLTDFEVTTISETVNIGNGLSLNFQRKGEFVLVRFSGSLTAINSGTYFSTAVPAQWRPDGTKELIGHFASGALAFHVDLETDGRVKWWGASGATGAPRGTAMYFLK
ncbi:hypothetical protein QYM42_11610 [Lactococcus lactis]|uniref:hypothetical protein n=1 Tax=Lactococcus lactis TaxID=1358 RepID=UPI0026586E5C|nr:hypothetical protein [Lactococcus lactis]WKF73007.1 hypothetical protein QYM42_11610 [Lactococcus lactis]